jgi:hypothetical protein
MAGEDPHRAVDTIHLHDELDPLPLATGICIPNDHNLGQLHPLHLQDDYPKGDPLIGINHRGERNEDDLAPRLLPRSAGGREAGAALQQVMALP